MKKANVTNSIKTGNALMEAQGLADNAIIAAKTCAKKAGLRALSAARVYELAVEAASKHVAAAKLDAVKYYIALNARAVRAGRFDADTRSLSAQ